MRAMLGFLRKMLARHEGLSPDDAQALRDAGVSEQAARDAIYVAYLFNIYNRAADAFDFEIQPDGAFTKAADFLLRVGYR